MTADEMNDDEMTYKEYDRRANVIANGIFNEGCETNSRIAVLAKNSVDYAEIQYGSIKSRTVLVGLNWRLAPPEVIFQPQNAVPFRFLMFLEPQS